MTSAGASMSESVNVNTNLAFYAELSAEVSAVVSYRVRFV